MLNMNRTTVWVLTVIVGITVGAAAFWFIGDPYLGIGFALVYAACTWLMIVYGPTLSGEVKGDDLETTRWSGAFIFVVMGAVTIGISAALPVSLELRIALQLFVIGVSWVGFLFGVAMTRSQLTSNDSAHQTAEESENGLSQ
jgi:small-conductance mechanosensitive channel